MSRRRFNPTSIKQDKRLIVRRQESFNAGTVSDVEPVDIPNNAVAKLINARGHKNAIRGRTGVKEWSSMTIPETKALGASYDATEKVLTGSWTHDDVGCTYYGDNGDYFFIKEYISATEVTVGASRSTETQTYVEGKVVPPINAQFFDNLNSVRYFLLGKKVYARIGRSEEWIEYFILGDQPTNTTSQMFKMKDKIVLTNSNGVFILNSVYDGRYGWKSNDYLPKYKLDLESPQISSTVPSAYNYLYTYTRLNGLYTEDRNSVYTHTEIETPPMLLEHEIIPETDYEPGDLNTDYAQMTTNEPLMRSKKKVYNVLNTSFNSFAPWIDLSEDNHNPCLTVVVDGEETHAYFEFVNVESMDDVASALRRGLKDVSIGFEVVRADKGGVGYFSIYNTDKDYVWSFKEYSSVDPLGADMILNNIIIESSDYEEALGVTIGTFRYPSNRKDITHYSVYRTKDIYPYTVQPVDLTDPRIGNSSNIYSWVADIPVIDTIEGDVNFNGSKWVFTLSAGGGDFMIGSTYHLDASGTVTRLKFVGKVNGSENEYYVDWIKGIPNNGVGLIMYTGTNTSFTAYKEGNVITFSDYTPVEEDIGKAVFWSDGTVSFLSSLTTTIDSEDKEPQRMYINPTERNYYDTMSDNERDGYAQYLTLKTRGYNKLPQSNLATYNKGLLVVALKDYNKLYYTGTSEMSTIGYHHINQVNDSIEKGIRCMFSVGDVFTFLTTSSTHTVNPKQATVLETEFGEFYTVMPDAFLVNGTIGGASQFRWANGEKGDVMVITNEPAVRFFDGSTYTANLADGKIQHTELQLLNENMLMSYSSTGGVHIWGYRSDLWKE